EKFYLSQNYPNPFNSSTRINYQLPKKSHVKIQIFNTLGQEIKMLVDTEQSAGYYSLHWDGRNNNGIPVVSGIYIYKILSYNFNCTKKMIVIR
ncbi:MAG: FlgD immunoglobulin-like domain containing protein, partial [Candidatus Hodarchaeota archaeon]